MRDHFVGLEKMRLCACRILHAIYNSKTFIFLNTDFDLNEEILHGANCVAIFSYEHITLNKSCIFGWCNHSEQVSYSSDNTQFAQIDSRLIPFLTSLTTRVNMTIVLRTQMVLMLANRIKPTLQYVVGRTRGNSHGVPI